MFRKAAYKSESLALKPDKEMPQISQIPRLKLPQHGIYIALRLHIISGGTRCWRALGKLSRLSGYQLKHQLTLVQTHLFGSHCPRTFISEPAPQTAPILYIGLLSQAPSTVTR